MFDGCDIAAFLKLSQKFLKRYFLGRIGHGQFKCLAEQDRFADRCQAENVFDQHRLDNGIPEKGLPSLNIFDKFGSRRIAAEHEKRIEVPAESPVAFCQIPVVEPG